MTGGLARVRAIRVLYIPCTRRGGGMLRVVKDISVAFVPGARAGTLRDQGERRLHIFLLDRTWAADRTATVSTRSWLLMQVVMGSGRIGRRIRNRFCRQRDRYRRRLLSTSLAAVLTGLVGCGHGGVKGRKLSHHPFIGLLFIGVNGLSMLTKVVETRELLSAVATERTFTSMFSD
jgi:hypothetical protein